MKTNSKALLAAAGVMALSWSPAMAYEAGGNPETKPGVLIGASAGVPPPGIYMIDQVFDVQQNLIGPGTKAVGGNVGAQAAVDVQAFLFVPGWTFLGGTVDFVIVQPWVMASVGIPVNFQAAGMHNTAFIAEDSWKLGASGFAVKTGLTVYVPDGTRNGIGPTSPVIINGLGGIGDPFWTFQPELILSYLKDGWNLSAAIYAEFNTANTVTQYTSGDILHADFTATKTIGKWTFGPVAYYWGQVSNDQCGTSCVAAYGGANPITAGLGNYQRSNVWAVGALVGYDFGPAALSVWATQEVSAKVSNPTQTAAGIPDGSLTGQGSTVFATLSYRLWAPEAPVAPMYHK
jgi:hypothetical protein